ncbi:MAG: TRAM domain-containing protein [Sphaerochaetaceae bacterium]
MLVTQVSRNDKSEMLGRTEHNEMVAFKADIPIGSMVRVHLEDLRGNTYGGTVV